ncbi:MAG: glycosyl transferase [Candidatus Cloacimonadota bacterium]|nr:MAG: glycosyl transferase [Candidatus Cloacimonadota bacterium]
MKVSIITVVYNNQDTIKDCIESVLSQDYSNIEYIIIDGKSNDDTLNVINSYQDKITTVISEKDDGLYHAMNKGISLATGELIGTLNSDDFYSNNQVITKIVQNIQTNQSDSCYANLVYVNPNDYKVLRYWYSGCYQKQNFLSGWMPPHPTFFVKKTQLDQFGYFNTNLINSADYELMLRLLYANNVSASYLDEVTIVMRNGGHSNMSLSNRLRANKEDRKSWKINNLTPNTFTLTIKFFIKMFQFFKFAPLKVYKPKKSNL